jgi:hypothetical protein
MLDSAALTYSIISFCREFHQLIPTTCQLSVHYIATYVNVCARMRACMRARVCMWPLEKSQQIIIGYCHMLQGLNCALIHHRHGNRK